MHRIGKVRLGITENKSLTLLTRFQKVPQILKLKSQNLKALGSTEKKMRLRREGLHLPLPPYRIGYENP